MSRCSSGGGCSCSRSELSAATALGSEPRILAALAAVLVSQFAFEPTDQAREADCAPDCWKGALWPIAVIAFVLSGAGVFVGTLVGELRRGRKTASGIQ